MDAVQVTPIERVRLVLRKISNSMRNALVDDVPPGMRVDGGATPATVHAFTALSDRHALSDLLPYESYDSSTGLYFNHDTVGFVLYVLPATALAEHELNVLNGIFTQQHKADTVIQVTMFGDPNIEPIVDYWASVKDKGLAPENAALIDLLSKNRAEYLKSGKWRSLFSDQPFLPRNYHLMISYTVPVPRGMAPVDLPSTEIEQLQRTRDSMIGVLKSARMYADKIAPDLFINLVGSILNPSQAARPRLQYDEENPINAQVVDADTMLLNGPGVSTLIHRDEKYSLLPFHVRQFPQSWAGYANGALIGDFTNNILRLPCSFLATLTVRIPDALAQKNMVKLKHTRATQMAGSPVAKYATQWADRRRDWQYTAERVDQGDKLLQAFYQVVLIAPQGGEEMCAQALTGVYDSIGWVLSRSRYTPTHALLGALPMGMNQEVVRAFQVFKHFRSRIAWNCTNLAPWIAEWKGTRRPLMLLFGRRGQAAYFDNFDNDKGNYNMAITAASGGGKSFITAEMVNRTLAFGGYVYIIDAGHSYRNLCNLHNGTYIDFGGDTPLRLNPFTYVAERAENVSQSEYADYCDDQTILLKLIIGQMASPTRPLTEKQNATLEMAIQAAMKIAGRNASITIVAEELGKLHQMTSDATAFDLQRMLRSYTSEGVYGRYFEGEANINLDSRFVVLDLDALNSKGDLQSVVLLFLMMRINHQMYLAGNKSVRKLCIIDEAWRLMGSGRAGKFIEEGYRVARKHGGAFATITQKVSDYFGSETAKAAFMNSDFSIYLRQKQAELDQAEKEGYITNAGGQLDVLRSLETIQGKYSEIAISSPDGLAVCRFIVDPITEKIYSTKADEVEFLRTAEKQGIPLFEAIKQLIARSNGR